jgi:hypothetical protein
MRKFLFFCKKVNKKERERKTKKEEVKGKNARSLFFISLFYFIFLQNNKQ